MLKKHVFTIIIHMLLSASLTENAVPHVLYGFFSGIDHNHIYYGSFDLDALKFKNLSTLSIEAVGDPNRIKNSAVPFAYNPHSDVVYMAALDSQNKTILSVVDATVGNLLSTFRSILYPIVSLQYDIFQNKLFAHIDVDGTLSYIGEINTSDGSVKRLLKSFSTTFVTSISSYDPTTGKYFFIADPTTQYACFTLDTNSPTNYTVIPIDVLPRSMRLDYKTSTMYITYVEEPDEFISSIGVLDRTTGDISAYVGTLTYNSSVVLTSLSTYDNAKNIYYVSIESSPANNIGIAYIDIDTAHVTRTLLPHNITKSHGWFIKQFGKKK